MEFKVVDVPDVQETTSTLPIIKALLANVGKAIQLDLEGRNANSYRKILRASLDSKNVLMQHKFHTKLDVTGKTMTVWLTPIEETEQVVNG